MQISTCKHTYVHTYIRSHVLYMHNIYVHACILNYVHECISRPKWPIRGTTRNAWRVKLFLSAVLAYPMDCVSLRVSHTESAVLLFLSDWLL